ncbi:helix-turn-helix domain-containing protein [Glacieibacterium megasporae]|uniref:helix-turn-helix domain-containing protein n=1 Tax=Glacieibacterium megasporae TaxID=2835787 RepID=UPI002104654D|nr:XRE family transcriptional regulator [Polymorphobacter megasporae]
MTTTSPTLGALLRAFRFRKDWTLKEMSTACGIPLSTLSKIEHDRLTLTYDKLQVLSRRLGMRMSELFAETDDDARQSVTARRSVGTVGTSIRVETPNYDYYYLCTELRKKRMIPVLAKIRAKSAEEFGELVKHAGEEYIYVLRGRIVVITEFYDPVVLGEGESIYIDSTMGHGYLVADGCEEAETIGVMSSADEELTSALMALHGDRSDVGPIQRLKR